MDMSTGVVGLADAGRRRKTNGLGRPARAGESPVVVSQLSAAKRLSTAGHANPAGSRVVHDPRLNTLDDR